MLTWKNVKQLVADALIVAGVIYVVLHAKPF